MGPPCLNYDFLVWSIFKLSFFFLEKKKKRKEKEKGEEKEEEEKEEISYTLYFYIKL